MKLDINKVIAKYDALVLELQKKVIVLEVANEELEKELAKYANQEVAQ